jgi:hypothetical protein
MQVLLGAQGREGAAEPPPLSPHAMLELLQAQA